MTRSSSDQIAVDGTIFTGFDYNVQVWVVEGICQDVGASRKWAGIAIKDVPGHEMREG